MEYAIETRCNDCVFAKIGEGDWDCKLNLISKFVEQGYEKKIKDGNYTIPGKGCWNFRTSLWSEELGLGTFEKQKERVRQEVHLKVDVVVYLTENQTLDDLSKTISSIENNTHKPKRIYILNMSGIRPSELIHWCPQNIKLPYNIEFPVKQSLKNALTIIYKKTKNVYVSVIEGGSEIPPDYYEKLNKLIFENMERVLMIMPCNGNYHGLFFLRFIFKQLGYNNEKCAIEKLKNVTKDQGSEFLIKEHKEVFDES